MAITQITVSDSFFDSGNTIDTKAHSYYYTFPLNQTSELENAYQNKIFLGVRCTHSYSLTNDYSNLLGAKGSVQYFKCVTTNHVFESKTPTNVFVTDELTELQFYISYSLGGRGITQKYYDKIHSTCTLDYYFADSQEDINLNLIETQNCTFTAQIKNTSNWDIIIIPNQNYHPTSFNGNSISQNTSNRLTRTLSTTYNNPVSIICELNVYQVVYKNYNGKTKNCDTIQTISYNSGQTYSTLPSLPSKILNDGYYQIGWISTNITNFSILCMTEANNQYYFYTASDISQLQGRCKVKTNTIITIVSELSGTYDHNQQIILYAAEIPYLTEYYGIDVDPRVVYVPYDYTIRSGDYDSLQGLYFKPKYKNGYTVSYWYQDNMEIASGNRLTPSTTILTYGSLNQLSIYGGRLTCIYTPNEYTVTINDGENTYSSSYTFEEDEVILTAAQKENKKFLYWSNSANDIKIYQDNYSYIINYPAAITWTAHFVPNNCIVYDSTKIISQIYFFDNNGTQHEINFVYTNKNNSINVIYQKNN